MRVVYLNPCGKLGGAETSLLEIMASLHAAAPEWEIHLVLGEDGPFADEARARGAQVTVEPFPAALARLGDSRRHPLMAIGNLLRAAGSARSYRRRLARILKKLRPDAIHTNGFKMHVLGAWARPRSTPLIWHIHDYVSTRRLMSRLLRLFRRACSMAVVNSQSVASDVQTVLPNLKVVPIYNAIDLQRFSPDGSRLDLDALAGLPQPAGPVVRVGLIGTFARWKGHQVFLEALARLAPGVNVRGYVVGGPIYQTSDSQWAEEELRREADRLGVSGRVGFTGFLRDIPSVMRSLDIVVHASTQPEPFGMVIIEAMACGRAVIVSASGGSRELFVAGQEALAHSPGDAQALADAIWHLASDTASRARLGKAGRERAERLFDARRLAGELLSVYEKVSGGRASVEAQAVIQSSVASAVQSK